MSSKKKGGEEDKIGKAVFGPERLIRSTDNSDAADAKSIQRPNILVFKNIAFIWVCMCL